MAQKVVHYLGYFLRKIASKTFKNNPIWSQCFGQCNSTVLVTVKYDSGVRFH